MTSPGNTMKNFSANRKTCIFFLVVTTLAALFTRLSEGQGSGPDSLRTQQGKSDWTGHVLAVLKAPDSYFLAQATTDIIENVPTIPPEDWPVIFRQCMQQIRSLSANSAEDTRLALARMAAAVLFQLRAQNVGTGDVNYVVTILSQALNKPYRSVDDELRSANIESFALLGERSISTIQELAPSLTESEFNQFLSKLQTHYHAVLEPMPRTASFLAQRLLENHKIPRKEEILRTIDGIGAAASQAHPAIQQSLKDQNSDCQALSLRIIAKYETLSILPDGTTLASIAKCNSDTSRDPAKMEAAGRTAKTWDQVRQVFPDFAPAPETTFSAGAAQAHNMAELAFRLASRKVIDPSPAFLKAAIKQEADLSIRESAVLFVANIGRLQEFSADVLSAFEDSSFAFDWEIESLPIKLVRPADRAPDESRRILEEARSLMTQGQGNVRIRALTYEMLAILGELPPKAKQELQDLLLSKQLPARLRHRLILRLSPQEIIGSNLNLNWDAILQLQYEAVRTPSNMRDLYEAMGALGIASEGMQRRLSANLKHSEHSSISLRALRKIHPRSRDWAIQFADASQVLESQKRSGESRRLIYAIHYVANSPALASAFQTLLPLSGSGPVGVNERDLILSYLKSIDSTDQVRSEFIVDLLRSLGRRCEWRNSDSKVLDEVAGSFATKGMAPEEHAVRDIQASLPSASGAFIAFMGQTAATYWPLVFLHPAAWIAILFWYPRSRRIQSIFIFNPSVRKFFGFGYVNAMICGVPYLARKILQPFRATLSSSIGLGATQSPYFSDRDVASGEQLETLRDAPHLRHSVKEVLPAISGKVLIVGVSGVGKSALLRNIANEESTCVAYLRAIDCSEGIPESIARRLPVSAQDLDFVKALILAGAVKIIVDGLNECTETARKAVMQFANDFPLVDILIASQPMPFEFSSTVKVFWLLPLRDEQILDFVYTQLGEGPKAGLEEFKEFLTSSLNPELPPEELTRNREILLNPLDLLFVSELLAEGEQPDIQGILNQQHLRMCSYYRQLYGVDFPEQRFARYLYSSRLASEMDEFSAAEFAREWDSLNKFKLGHPQPSVDPATSKPNWVMRHPRICDFYTAICWRIDEVWERANSALTKHADDPRFWGTYYLLVDELNKEQRQALINKLLRWSAKQNKHALLDRLVAITDSKP